MKNIRIWIAILLVPFFFTGNAFAAWLDQCSSLGTTSNSVLDACPSGVGGYFRAPDDAQFCSGSSAAGYCFYGPAGKTALQAEALNAFGCVAGGIGVNTCTVRTSSEDDCISRVPNCSGSPAPRPDPPPPVVPSVIDYGAMVVNANVNNRRDKTRDRLIDFFSSNGTPIVASVDYVPDTGPEPTGIAYFPSGTKASFNRDVHPTTLQSMQFTFADVELKRDLTSGTIQKNTGNIVLKKSTGSVIKTIPISSPFVTLGSEEGYYDDGNYPPDYNTFSNFPTWPPYSRDISIDFTGLGIQLENDTAYTITFARGILKNTKKTSGLSKAITISFKTGHPVSLLSLSPISGSTVNLPPSNMLATYNAPVGNGICKIFRGLQFVTNVSCLSAASNNAIFEVYMNTFKPLDPETKYTLKVSGVTDLYAAYDLVPMPVNWNFTTGKPACSGGSGDGTGSSIDKAKQKACRVLKASFLCQKVFGCAWDGAQCNRQITCTYQKAPANATDILCARYAGDEDGCGKLASCQYSGSTCSRR